MTKLQRIEAVVAENNMMLKIEKTTPVKKATSVTGIGASLLVVFPTSVCSDFDSCLIHSQRTKVSFFYWRTKDFQALKHHCATLNVQRFPTLFYLLELCLVLRVREGGKSLLPHWKMQGQHKDNTAHRENNDNAISFRCKEILFPYILSGTEKKLLVS